MLFNGWVWARAVQANSVVWVTMAPADAPDAESIWFAFEKAREPLEVHCAMVSPGEMLQRGAVGLTKGFTRCAVILYAIIRTLMVQDGESMTEPEREFFTQCRGFKIEPGCDIKVSTSCCCGCPNPDTTHR